MSSSTEQSFPREPTSLRAHARPTWTTELPRPLTSFVGREREIVEVRALLERDGIRLLTLTGPGGVGKTRLAVQVLEQRDDDRFDTVAFVPLAAVRDPALVPPAIAQALGVPNTPDQPITVRLHAFLATRRTLLVLDNLEHLLETGPFVADLLANCPALTVLGTSRSRLNLSAEHAYSVRPLPIDASITLFEQRTRAISPGFLLDQNAIPTINAICQQLDRLPLAIELAAARSTALSPQSLLARLQNPLALLTGGPRDAPDRQRTMRDVIAWSYNLLSEDEQRLFRRLGVFVGGFTLEAAEPVAGVGDVFSGLESLVTSSLLTIAPDVSDSPRFTMLETLREFALEHLAAAGEEAATRRLHAGYFVNATESELPTQDGPELRAVHDRIEADLQNCRSAMAWALEMNEAELGIRLAGAIWRTWFYGQGYGERPWQERMNEGRTWLDRTLGRRNGLPVSVLAEALAGAAHLAFLHGDLSTAQAWGEELLTRAQAESYAYGSMWAGLQLGIIAYAQHDDATAIAKYKLALEATANVRSRESSLSIVLGSLGRVEGRHGNISAAVTHFEEALALSRSAGNPYAISQVAGYFGHLMRTQGHLPRAALLLQEAMGSYLEQRVLGGVAFSLSELGLVAFDAKQPERAVAFLAVAHSLPFDPDDRPAYVQAIASVRGSVPEPAYDVAWNAGLQMTWEMVVAEIAALTHDLERSLTPGGGSTDKQHGLTRREREVLQLLVEGRSNRAIADELSLSQRTVEHHVLHILTKLGLESRTAVVAFAVRHGLA